MAIIFVLRCTRPHYRRGTCAYPPPVPRILAVLPLKAFDHAKERLDLPPQARAAFAKETATVVAAACLDAGLELAVVTADERVAAWARRRGAAVVADPGAGLAAAAAAGAQMAHDDGRDWLVVHGDLPLLGPDDLAIVAEAIGDGVTVLAPSRDGGTNLLGSSHPLAFRYGPGSFARHLAAAANRPRLVVVRTGTAVEVDTLADLRTASRLPRGTWLERFLF